MFPQFPQLYRSIPTSFLQLGHTLWVGRHIRSELILDKLSPGIREGWNCIIYLLGAIAFLIIFGASLQPFIESWKILEFEGEGALRVPVYPIRTIIVLGSAAAAIHFLVQVFKSIFLLKRKSGRA